MSYPQAATRLIGHGRDAVLMEVLGNTVRFKRAGGREFHLPLSAAADVAAFLTSCVEGPAEPLLPAPAFGLSPLAVVG